MMEVQQVRDQVADKALIFQDRVKKVFDSKENPNDFQQGDLVLKWDTRHEYKGKHGKFDHLWKGPYLITKNHGNNSYSLQGFDGDPFSARPINGRFLEHYITS